MRFRTLLLVPTLAIGACSTKESVTPRPVNLTRQEAMDVAFILAYWTDNSGIAPSAETPMDPSLIPPLIDWKFNCFAGGTMLLEWRHNIKVNAENLLFADSIRGTMRQTACTYVLENIKITVTNDSPINYTKISSYMGGKPTEPFVVHVDGAFRWNTDDGRNGSCAIRYRQAFDLALKTFHQSGNVCGHVIDKTLRATQIRLKNMPWEVNQPR
jgi:hypothetical protein